MVTQHIDLELSGTQAVILPHLSSITQLRGGYESLKNQFQAQTTLLQRYFRSQASEIGDAIAQGTTPVHINLPDQVVIEGKIVPVPAHMRSHVIGGMIERITHKPALALVEQRFTELELSNDLAVSTSAMLLRFASSLYLVKDLLPSGHAVAYQAAEGDDIPEIPVDSPSTLEPALTAATDAIALEETRDSADEQLLTPYVPAARRFYLPQWVAIDDAGALLVSSVQEAEAHLRSMQSFMAVLAAASSLAPFIVADEEYQKKRYGMLGQIANQGHALSHYVLKEMIETIRRRAGSHTLDRGLTLILPYFDDQALEIREYELKVIPTGRIMFIGAFIVLAAREAQVRVMVDRNYNPSTRKHLLNQLKLLEQEFAACK